MKLSIEQSTQRQFEKRHLALILAVFPEAYTVSMQRQKHGSQTSFGKIESAQLVIEGNLKVNTLAEQNAVLFDRRVEFHRRLLDMVKKQHAAFLDKSSKPWDNKKAWHAEFPLSKCFDIIPAALPEAPVLIDSPLSSATNKANLESLLLGSSHQLVEREKMLKRLQSNSAASEMDGVNMGTLARVRMQEKISSVEESAEFKARQRRKYLLEGLPLLCDMIWSLFSSQDRSTMQLDTLVDILSKSHKKVSITRDDISEQLTLLVDLAPSWCRVFQTDGTTWFKLLKEVKLCVDAKLRSHDLYKDMAAQDMANFVS